VPTPVRPHATALAALMAVVVPVTAAEAACPRPEPASAASLVRQIGALRAAHGVPALRPQAPIARPARAHSTRMARAGRLWHDDLRGWSSGRVAAQNVAAGGVVAAAMSAMTHSPRHRAALLSRRFRHVGVGAVRDCGGMLVVTVNMTGPAPR